MTSDAVLKILELQDAERRRNAMVKEISRKKKERKEKSKKEKKKEIKKKSQENNKKGKKY